jgi:MarR family transcriptional regulator for hemolysin
LPAWLVLLNLKIRPTANQRALADAVGIREATLTHRLNAMQTDGLLTRRRDHNNRLIHVVELTDAGEAAFLRLRDAAVAFDRRLRRGMTAGELASLEDLLGRLVANVEPREDGSTPWAGLIETERWQHSAVANAPSPEIPKQSLATGP